MTSGKINKLDNFEENSSTIDEIDFNIVFEFFLRRKKILSIFTIIGGILGFALALNLKRTWQGGFQIVLESEDSKKPSSLLSNLSPQLANLANPFGIGTGSNDIKTEIGILSSPSVLMSIFDYVNDEKASKSKTNKNLRFSGWKKDYLKIELEENTSILNINYKDTNKDLIIPVLEKISNTYQDYSSKARKRQFELGEKYYKDQISLYTEKSKESLIKSQKFASEQNLSLISSDSDSDSDSEVEEAIVNSINIEVIRVKAANEIKFIEAQLEKINTSKKDIEEILYQSSLMPEIDSEGLPNKLNEIESELLISKTVYMPNDLVILKLEREKNLLLNLLKKRLVGLLNAKKQDAEALIKSTERPKGVLIQYRTLLSAAKKDALTLNKLENEYRLMSLERARDKDPWQLITNPTLLPYPISPNRKTFLAFGLITGFSLGCVYCAIYEKKNNLLYSSIEIKKLNKYPLLEEINIKNKNETKNSLEILINSNLFTNFDEIALLSIGNIDQNINEYILDEFKNTKSNPSFLLSQNFSEVLNSDNIILITEIGKTKKDELQKVKKLISLHNKKSLGMIILNNN